MAYFYLYILVQVVIESLPVSSSSHILFLNTLLLSLSLATQNNALYARSYYAALDHVLHGVTGCIVAYFFRARWLFLVRNWRRCLPIIVKLITRILIIDGITAFFFVASRVYPITLPVPMGLAITALLLYSLRWLPSPHHTLRHQSNTQRMRMYNTLDMRAACILGIAQGLAVTPGISRFAIVYVTSQWLGFSARKGFLVTWTIFWPLLMALSAHGVYQLTQQQLLHTLATIPAFAVLLLASMIGYGAFTFAAHAAYTRTLWLFSIYVALFACIVALLS